MKLNKNKSKLKPFLLAAIAVLAIVLLLFALEKSNIINLIGRDSSTQGPTKEEIAKQNEVQTEAKKDFIESKAPDQSNNGSTPVNSRIELSAKKEGDNTVTVLTKLYGVANGSCSLRITNGSQSFNQSAEVIYQPEFATCAGFSVPVSKLGKGTWVIVLQIDDTETMKTINYTVD